MATLGTQNISTTYNQVLKTYGSNIVDTTLRNVSSGDEAGVSALQISTTGVKSTGTFAVDGAATFGSNITASTGTATVGTLRIGTGSNLIAQSYGTAAFTAATLGTVTTGSAISTGTFALANVAMGDIVVGSINYTVSGFQPTHTFRPESAGVARFVVANSTSTLGTLSAGTIFATALRYS